MGFKFHVKRHKADFNQKEIVKRLRETPGVTVLIANIAQLDIIVGFRGRSFLYEIKSDTKKKLKASQDDFSKMWSGHWKRVNSYEEIMNDLGLLVNLL